MQRLGLSLVVLTLLPVMAVAEEHVHTPTASAAGHAHQEGPAGARDPDAYADGYKVGEGPYAVTATRSYHLGDEHPYGSLIMKRLERAYMQKGTASVYDLQASYGSDLNRLVLKGEGEVRQGALEDARTEVLWGHALDPYWDGQLGVRLDKNLHNNRQWLALGVEGLAPYWLDVEATAYAGDQGRSALRLETDYALLLTQRLVLEPRLELSAYGKNDRENRIGSGFSQASAGLRLRYEITRQFAPYIGLERDQKYGRTKHFSRLHGESTGETRWVAGVRFWL